MFGAIAADADTLACITGIVAEAHYGGVPRVSFGRRWNGSTTG
ncbi:MAG TPA: hypothetical protein VGF24_23155 [Vicinamibacterales bacterium]|jgi:hypothetical protein